MSNKPKMTKPIGKEKMKANIYVSVILLIVSILVVYFVFKNIWVTIGIVLLAFYTTLRNYEP